VRLNGIIKTGQDAIQQEQELVTKLKQQLEEREKVSKREQPGYRAWAYRASAWRQGLGRIARRQTSENDQLTPVH
jgi:hypothetical protein